MVKMTQNGVKLILWHSEEISTRDGFVQLYFNSQLPEPFAWEKIPQASITVSRTWKLSFTSFIIWCRVWECNKVMH